MSKMLWFLIKGHDMTSLATMPSLSEDGWVTDSIKTADYLLSHLFLSERSQSYLYNNNITSLPYILQTTQGDITQTITLLRSSIEEYFSRYFNNVVVEVTDVTSEDEPSKASISLFVQFSDKENIEHNLGKIIETSNLTISKIIDINNG